MILSITNPVYMINTQYMVPSRIPLPIRCRQHFDARISAAASTCQSIPKYWDNSHFRRWEADFLTPDENFPCRQGKIISTAAALKRPAEGADEAVVVLCLASHTHAFAVRRPDPER